MRSPVLTIAIVFVLAVPCGAFAGGKKDTIEIQQGSFQSSNKSNNTGSGSSARVVSPTTKAPIGAAPDQQSRPSRPLVVDNIDKARRIAANVAKLPVLLPQ
jgi:hypothetical protein